MILELSSVMKEHNENVEKRLKSLEQIVKTQMPIIDKMDDSTKESFKLLEQRFESFERRIKSPLKLNSTFESFNDKLAPPNENAEISTIDLDSFRRLLDTSLDGIPPTSTSTSTEISS
ncbi:Hypothetical predicted protein, partial [Paramuricea clavata]